MASSYYFVIATLVATCLHVINAASTSDFQAKCLSLKPRQYIRNSTRTVLEYVPGGTNLTFPDNVASCSRPNQVVASDICRLALSIPTSHRSSITFEAWLPRDWTGRFLGTGNGGIDGCIKYEDLAYGSSQGFATVGSNNGHNGTTAIAMLNNLDVTTDFAWRSLHKMVTSGKKLTKAFYQKSPTKSYYMGCSLGGRQGIKAAEIFPHDFDGIVAGSPAVDFNNLVSWRASFFPITGSVNSSNFITADTWDTLIHNEVLNQCDGLDGVLDGIIEDPTICSFRPEAMACSGPTNTTDCLTPTQVEIVKRVFSPFLREDGELIYPAMQPGSEIYAAEKLYAGAPFSYSDDWFKYVVYSNPNWNASTFNLKDTAAAEALNPGDIQTWPSSLATFQSIGGKMISFHGQQDNQITSFNTPRFYDHLLRGMRATTSELDEFFRFFRISGMYHCNSGPGAWVLGQGGGASAKGIPFVPQNNVLAALVAWVENGTAPETITGTKFKNDDPTQGISLQRSHCKYPLRNTYLGGNSSRPESWACLPTGTIEL
ncbi:Tannase/feruloyl esterase [Talaromyces proteolyticus]|uniref:Carboxylic ester hydrolase n=1 Tax=Talaromyces proteolyticus TaxID=1131652 RepID=A0AAD4Q3V0_9EURO|nr:Tannase/feruloyl esterase [Talaromyces proteolyticus]KAH8705459.1 Tannase/feruloyl esterase [Talaromyces proteolyticus]